MNIDMITFLSDILFTTWEGLISVILLKTYTPKKISLKIDVLWIFLFVLLVETMTFLSVSSTLKVLLEYFLFYLHVAKIQLFEFVDKIFEQISYDSYQDI